MSHRMAIFTRYESDSQQRSSWDYILTKNRILTTRVLEVALNKALFENGTHLEYVFHSRSEEKPPLNAQKILVQAI
jgi:hypothetical protein